MEDFNIPDEVNYTTYIDHAKSLKYAGDENLKLFLKGTEEVIQSNDDDLKFLGLLRAALILYAYSIELILKARGLYEDKEIKQGEITTFREFMNKWKGKSNGHVYSNILNHYSIDISENEKDLLDNLQSYTKWNGRYPFPSKGKAEHGKLEEKLKNDVQDFIDKQLLKMGFE